MSKNPVHKDADGWWFWQECWTFRRGPFNTQGEAEEALNTYARQLKETTHDDS